MRKLEEALGFELFDRQNGFRLSPQGRAFWLRAEPSFASLDQLQRDVELLRRGGQGEIHIACEATVADGPLGIAVGRLLDNHPDLRVKLLVCRVEEMPALLSERTVDFLVADHTLIPADEQLEHQMLADREVMFYCRAGHPLAGRHPIQLEEFFSYPLFGPPLPEWAHEWVAKHRPSDAPLETLRLECNHHSLLKAAVLASDGISGAPFSVIEAEVDLGRLAVLNLEAAPTHHPAAIFWLKSNPPSPAGRLLIDELLLIAGA
jgi:DNA-binding transcriptional LysR family regulator